MSSSARRAAALRPPTDHAHGDLLPILRRCAEESVAINTFDDSPVHGEAEMREALDLLPETPLVTCDARDRTTSTKALIALVEYLQTHHNSGAHSMEQA